MAPRFVASRAMDVRSTIGGRVISKDPQDAITIREHIDKSYQYGRTFAEQWRNLPEIPTRREIMPDPLDTTEYEEEWNDYQRDPLYNPLLPANIIDRPWTSKSAYIGAHYEILREDGIAPLRDAVMAVKKNPMRHDSDDFCIYTDVHIIGLKLSSVGAAFRVEFSFERAGKRIRWEQSKRLRTGTLVALSPSRDMFRTICKIAVVASRPISGGLDQNPPKIDLFWGDDGDADIDPDESYMMVESKLGYFEAYRHMLVAMQKLMTEKFPLANHLVHLDTTIEPPAYLEENPFMNLTSLLSASPGDPHLIRQFENVNVLETVPHIPYQTMDDSQMEACTRMFTMSLAIIQGPPGTGKTFTSINALRIMLDNWCPEDPPIVVAAQTNHAIDQLLDLVEKFEPEFLRLGGRSSKQNQAITNRTLHELRRTKDKAKYRSIRAAYGELKLRVEEIKEYLAPLLESSLLSVDVLLKRGIITQSQSDSLHEDSWITANDPELPSGSLSAWVGAGQLVQISSCPPINMGLEEEEVDLEFEQLRELELELGESPEDFEEENLAGAWVPFQEMLTGRTTSGYSDKKMRRYLADKQNLYEIPSNLRGEVYRYFQRQLKRQLAEEYRTTLVSYVKTINNLKIAKWESNVEFIRRIGIKIIGCTTTGLSKYRGLLTALNPRILLIEEAAETLEGTIIASMFQSIQQLILVGDHQQLQAHCNIPALQYHPYNLGVSMFERLINNSIEYTMLNRQRRMIPDIRKLLCIEPYPFYPNLEDHPAVLDRVQNRPPIPGMGGKDTYFFHHTWPESINPDLSRYNLDEAEMVVGFYNYLILNGIKHSQISILTFYNGQRKAILKCLRNHRNIGSNTYFNVFTIDSYQGEENDVILLSLVRSNEYLNIGFLENKNRLVVALSRARRGLYIFGNAITLSASECAQDKKLWEPLLTDMAKQGHLDVDAGLPITCTNHGIVTEIREADQWRNLAGGCVMKCGGQFSCGHSCPYTCHPKSHDELRCPAPCSKSLMGCGHSCIKLCSEPCACKECTTKENEFGKTYKQVTPTPHSAQQSRSNSPQKLARYQTPIPSPVSTGSPSKKSSSPSSLLPTFHPTTSIEDWNTWNAATADKNMANLKQNAMRDKAQPTKSMPMINETHHAVEIHGNMRVRKKESPVRRLIQSAQALSLEQSLPEMSRNSSQIDPSEDLISFD
ncbi:P-loop containing nucleoside triphosphate hydrolase protein [Xylogone sp. PMI_703]|nr:P-loop containing nucleoside triphosphate hydrolase protein [Xylogone sp. PMI_703]